MVPRLSHRRRSTGAEALVLAALLCAVPLWVLWKWDTFDATLHPVLGWIAALFGSVGAAVGAWTLWRLSRPLRIFLRVRRAEQDGDVFGRCVARWPLDAQALAVDEAERLADQRLERLVLVVIAGLGVAGAVFVVFASRALGESRMPTALLGVAVVIPVMWVSGQVARARQRWLRTLGPRVVTVYERAVVVGRDAAVWEGDLALTDVRLSEDQAWFALELWSASRQEQETFVVPIAARALDEAFVAVASLRRQLVD